MEVAGGETRGRRRRMVLHTLIAPPTLGQIGYLLAQSRSTICR